MIEEVFNIQYLQILGVNILSATLIMILVGMLSSLLFGVNLQHELAHKDNFAFGILVASLITAIMLIVTTAVSGNSHASLLLEALEIMKYGLVGIILMLATKLIFDKIVMHQFCIKTSVIEGNIAVSIINGCNLIATSVFISTITSWLELNTVTDYYRLLLYYFIGQVFLSLLSYIRVLFFKLTMKKEFHEVILKGNIALAIRFSSFNIATAIVLITVFKLFKIYPEISYWYLFTIATFIIAKLYLLTYLVSRVVLLKIDLRNEIVNQGNIAVAIIQAVTVLSLSLIIMYVLVI